MLAAAFIRVSWVTAIVVSIVIVGDKRIGILGGGGGYIGGGGVILGPCWKNLYQASCVTYRS